MFSLNLITAFFLGLITLTTATTPGCEGGATYKVVFQNWLTPAKFGDLIPEGGLVFAPIAGVSHSNRQSFLTVRGFATRPVQAIAETGNTFFLIRRARALRKRGEGVKSFQNTTGPTGPGLSSFIELEVDCEHTFVTVLSMIAPSPDWIVQISNMNLYDARYKTFVKRVAGDLIAYDAGTDDGRDFTNPADPTLDIPTVPRKNIAPLVEDETDRFEGRVVGRFLLFRTS